MGVSQSGCPHRWVLSAAGRAPLVGLQSPGLPPGQLQGVWLQSPLPRLMRAQPQDQHHDRSGQPSTSPQSTLYLSKFGVLHIEDPILHWSLHGPSPRWLPAQGSGTLPQRRKCDCCSRMKSMGQTSFSERLPLFGVWDGGQRLGHRRCPCARPPPRSRAVGQNAGAEHRKHLGERLT